MPKTMTVRLLQKNLQNLYTKVDKLSRKRAKAIELADRLYRQIETLLGGKPVETPVVPEPVKEEVRRPPVKPVITPGRKRGRPAKRGPGRPPKAGKRGRPAGKVGRPKGKVGRPAGKRGPGRPPKTAAKVGRPAGKKRGRPGRKPGLAKAKGPSFHEAAVAAVKSAKKIHIDKLMAMLAKQGFRYRKAVFMMQLAKMGLKKDKKDNISA